MIKQIYNKIKEWLIDILDFLKEVWKLLALMILCLMGLVWLSIFVVDRTENSSQEISIEGVKIIAQEVLKEYDFLTKDEVINTVMDLYYDIDIGESVKTLIMEVGERGPRGFKGEKGEINQQDIIDALYSAIVYDGVVKDAQFPKLREMLKGDKGDKGDTGEDGISIMGPIGLQGEMPEGYWKKFCYTYGNLRFYDDVEYCDTFAGARIIYIWIKN